jgi:hypothetical protein
MSNQPVGCARPTGTVLGEDANQGSSNQLNIKHNLEETTMTVKVGAKAPDFQAPTYYKGEFSSIKLTDYLGKWVLLCFYPGDFTFV